MLLFSPPLHVSRKSSEPPLYLPKGLARRVAGPIDIPLQSRETRRYLLGGSGGRARRYISSPGSPPASSSWSPTPPPRGGSRPSGQRREGSERPREVPEGQPWYAPALEGDQDDRDQETDRGAPARQGDGRPPPWHDWFYMGAPLVTRHPLTGPAPSAREQEET